MSGKVTIHKVGGEDPAQNIVPVPEGPPAPLPSPSVPTIQQAATRTYPRGILKTRHARRKTARILPTADPARPPPTRRQRLRLSTSHTAESRHKSLHHKAEKLPLKTIRKKLVEKGIVRADRKVTPAILRSLFAESIGAGLLPESTAKTD
jgi:hypothetical protein